MFFLISTPAWATTYHVGLTGGTGTRCNGSSSASDPGSGTNQNCAFNHPAWAIGATGTSGVMVAGDTLQFDDTGPYMIGYGMPNTSGCVDVSAYNCLLNGLPAGTDSSHLTNIWGPNKGNSNGTKVQLWGTQRVFQVLDISGANHIDIESIELTDHSNCIENGPIDGTIGGDPVHCERDTYPFGTWGSVGLNAGSATTDVHLTDMDIHGMAKKGIFAYHNGDWTLTRVKITGNGFVGWDSDGSGDDSYTGTTDFETVTMKFNGCGETYPLTTSDLTSVSNLHHCWSQGQGGYGDAVGLGDGNTGNWIVNLSDISNNVSDGIDLLHGSDGVIKITRSKVEGNAGNPVKITGTLNYIEHSLIASNCNFFAGQSFTSTITNDESSLSCTNNTGTWDGTKCSKAFDNCRAFGNAIVFANSTAGQIMRVSDSTVIGNSDSLIISQGTGCDVTTKIYAYNNIFLGGNDVDGGDTTDYYFPAGATGISDGACGTLALTEDYNQIFGIKNGASNINITGTHSRYGDPLLTGQTTLKMTTSPYYQGTDISTLVILGATSPSRYAVTGANSADESVTLISGSNDYNNNSRGSTWDGGAIQFGTNYRFNGGFTITGKVAF